MNKNHILYYVAVCGSLFFAGVLSLKGSGSMDVLGLFLMGASVLLFSGGMAYFISQRIRTRRNLILYYICSYIGAVGVFCSGPGYMFYVDNYKVYTGHQEMYVHLGEALTALSLSALGVIAVLGLTGSIIARKIVSSMAKRKQRSLTLDEPHLGDPSPLA